MGSENNKSQEKKNGYVILTIWRNFLKQKPKSRFLMIYFRHIKKDLDFW